ncbi:MAG: MarR family transcriptional regulator, partial [Stackebrandtia sp.]
ARKFAITPLGSGRLRHDRDTAVSGLAEVLADWPTEEVDNLVSALRRLNIGIERATGRFWPRP